MNDRPLPHDIIDRFGHMPDSKFRGGNEWSSACPKCGGAKGNHDLSDRFRMWERQGRASNFWCRRCGFMGFADDNKPHKAISPERMKELDDMRAELAKQEEARLQAKIKQLNKNAYYQGYHDAMKEQHRAMWRREGIPDSLQDWFKLGFKPHHQFMHGSKSFNSPAMTIPVFDVGWTAVNVQYRLLTSPSGAGKYRFTAGLPAPLYLTDPDHEPNGKTILVEGAKKAIVLYAHLGHKYNVVAVPSKSPGGALIDRLSNCDLVYIVLDPDAYTDGKSAKRIGDMMPDRARFVRLPAKPDDLIVQYGFTETDFYKYLDGATRTY